mmetsp:Transcript_31572/g.94113  ORF Transcript_31572/g.94113 Transcript_31572/m.94113 type:complete len:235 (-) Transcript_31572:2467-3171(-)
MRTQSPSGNAPGSLLPGGARAAAAAPRAIRPRSIVGTRPNMSLMLLAPMAAADGSLPLRTRDAPSMVGAGWLAVGAPTVGCSAPCVPSPAASCASGLVANGNDWRGLTVLAAREPFRPLKPESRRAAPPCALYTSPPSGASLRWVALVRRPDRPSRMLLVIASTLATRLRLACNAARSGASSGASSASSRSSNLRRLHELMSSRRPLGHSALSSSCCDCRQNLIASTASWKMIE